MQASRWVFAPGDLMEMKMADWKPKAPSIEGFTELNRAEWDNSLIFSLLFDPQTNTLPSAVD
jgi:hypothetical protein